MKTGQALIIAGAILLAGALMGITAAHADQRLWNDLQRAPYGVRVCIPAMGESTKLATLSSSKNTQLESGTIYEMSCNGTTGVYYELATAAAPTADNSSQYLADDTTIYISADADDVYIAAVDVGAAAGDCWLRACR